jgi:hypothetical protein
MAAMLASHDLPPEVVEGLLAAVAQGKVSR